LKNIWQLANPWHNFVRAQLRSQLSKRTKGEVNIFLKPSEEIIWLNSHRRGGVKAR
jgi:hypothetical protein